MTFTEEAVEAAAKAILDYRTAQGFPVAEVAPPHIVYMGEAKAALTAALSVMANTQKKDER